MKDEEDNNNGSSSTESTGDDSSRIPNRDYTTYIDKGGTDDDLQKK